MARVDATAPAQRPAAAVPNESTFCRRTPIGVCEPMPANFVLAATRDLCHSLLLQRKRSVVAEKAAKLAAQVRRWEHPSELMVNHAEVWCHFAVRANVRLDLRLAVADDKTRASHFERSDAAEKWQNDFAAFADNLTAGQALVFGPWFACLLLQLGARTMATVASDVCDLVKTTQLPTSPVDSDEESPAPVGLDEEPPAPIGLDEEPPAPVGLDEETPAPGPVDLDEEPLAPDPVSLDEEAVVTLLSKYVGLQPDRVLVNTVTAGFIHAGHKQIRMPPVSRAMIRATCFQWLAYSGMELLSLLCSFRAMYPAPFEKYVTLVADHADSSQKVRVEESQTALENFHATYKLERMGSFWMYVKVFEDDPATDISYGRHRWFCDLIVYVVDLLRTAVEVEVPAWSDEYQNFKKTKSMFQIATFSAADVELAKLIFDGCLAVAELRREK